MSVNLYFENSYSISKLITTKYSTSFSLAASLLDKKMRYAIYAIYGFVRLADEIVDSFHGYDQKLIFDDFKQTLKFAYDNKISTNPVLTAFVDTAQKYNLEEQHITAFMRSMECDLTKADYTNTEDLDCYIYGSADVVGLMCLKVFCSGKEEMYQRLKEPAEKLGSAFQKVNFLRDLKDDMKELGRSYFPEITLDSFNEETKRLIEESIQKDFDDAWKGLIQLPGRAKLAVALAFFYYKELFLKIKRTPCNVVLEQRIRISNFKKYLTIIKVGFMYKTQQF